MFCTHCGSKNADEATFCLQCGKSINATATAKPPQLRRGEGILRNGNATRAAPGWLILTVGLFAFAIVWRVIFLIPDLSSPAKSEFAEQELRRQKETEAFLKLTAAQHLAEAKSILKNRATDDSAFRYLNSIEKGDKEYKEAQTLLAQLKSARANDDREKAKASEVEAKDERLATDTLMQGQRVYLARKIEEIYLDGGMDVRVTAEGKKSDILKISYILMNRVFVHEFQKVNMEKLKEAEFRKIILTNGDDSWSFTL